MSDFPARRTGAGYWWLWLIAAIIVIALIAWFFFPTIWV